MERITGKLTLPYVKQPVGIFCMAQETQTGAMYQPRGVGWGGSWEGVSKEGIYVYLWLIHTEVWQKTTNSVKQLAFN